MRLSLALFSFTLFLSAALMFAVEPMIGKMLLPLVGGSPAGWIVAMAFFQCMLLAGYLYAHALSRFTPVKHGLIFAATLLIGCFFLPPQMTASTDNPGAFGVLLLLTKTIGWPFMALATASSTLQRLFTTTGHPHAKDPYFLYAASNLGSFGGLLAYPLIAEPFFGLRGQTHYWAYAYAVLIAFTLFCLFKSKNRADAAEETPVPPAPLAMKEKLNWLLLAFFPSSLLLGVTTHITTDIFSAPMIWTMPLGLYLLTFVIAFSRKPLVPLSIVSFLHPVAVMFVMAFAMIVNPVVATMSWPAVFTHLIVFTIVALTCHLKLAALRPADIRHLTVFYLMISIGGALGGIFNAFIAPVIFTSPIEYNLVLLLSLLVSPAIKQSVSTKLRSFAVISLLCLVFIVVIVSGAFNHHPEELRMLMLGTLVATIMVLSMWNTRTAFVFGGLLLVISWNLSSAQTIAQNRNFYGVVKVNISDVEIGGHDYRARIIQHGTTNHGMQVMDDAFKDTPIAYYIQGSPISEIFRTVRPRDVAIVGLGAGAMNCYSTPQSAFTFFEIDSAVADIANNYFSYLHDCKGRKPADIIIGDGRIEMNRLPAGRSFDLIMLDAFTADAIPLHLLTQEAMAGYLARLKPGGLLVFHISNRYFDLAPVLAKTADALDLGNRRKAYDPHSVSKYKLASIWMVLGRQDQAGIKTLQKFKKSDGWLAVDAPQQTKAWTDDYTYLLGTLKKRFFERK